MHIKAIPADIGKFAGAHPLMVGAAIVAVVAGGLYLRGGSAIASPSGASSADAGYSSFSYTVPSIIPNGGGGGASLVDSATAQSAGGLSSNDSALLSFEYYKEDHNFALATTDLANQIAIAGLNADVARASVAANLYSTNIGLAQSFLMSGKQFAAGKIGDFTFAFLGQSPASGSSKKARRMAGVNNAQFNSLLNNSTIQSLLGLGGSSSALGPVSASGAIGYDAQSTAGNGTVTAYGGATTSPTTTTGTSSGATSTTSGSSSGSTFVAANDTGSYSSSPTIRSANASLY